MDGMSSERNITLDGIARESTKLLGSDIHPVDLKERIDVTPVNDVEWSGLRGQSFCKPTSPELQEILGKYGESGIHYSLQGDPDFSKVAIAKVRISDMTEDMGHDYTSTIHKLLETDFAKENNISTPTQMRIYMKEHDLTIHEGSDGVTEYLLERKIHQVFRHYGGRGKIRGFDDPASDRFFQSKLSEGVVNLNKTIVKGTEIFEQSISETNAFVAEQAGKFLSEDIVSINRAGLESAMRTAAFAATLSVTKNTVSVIRGDIDTSKAVKEVLVDTSSASVRAYATGAMMEKFDVGHSEAALIVNTTVQISKQVLSYASGEIDGEQLIENVAETTAYMAFAYAGRMIGAFVGSAIIPGSVGVMIGQYIGEVITTAVCSEVISTIKFNKEFDRQNAKIIALYKNAEIEIRRSQMRLERIIQKENEELIQAIKEGFTEITIGIQNNSYEKIENGLVVIGSKFSMSKESLTEDKVTKETLFANSNEVLILE